MLFNGETFEITMKLFAKLQQNGTLYRKEDPELFDSFRNGEVSDMMSKIEKINKIRIVKVEDRLEMIPEVDNELYRFTNEELREKMNLSKNRELYTLQFMWMVILGKFYGEQYENTGEPRAFVPIDEARDFMDECVETFKKQKKEKIEEMTSAYELSISEIIETWDSLGTISEETKSIARSSTKDFGFMNKGLKFWVEQKLIVIHEQSEIVLTERGRIIPESYYHQEYNIQKINVIMKEMEEEEIEVKELKTEVG